LLQYRTGKFEDLLKAVKQVVSLLSPDKVSEKVPEMFHCVFMKLFEQPDFSVDHLREQDENKRTLLHYVAMLDGHIDAWEIILKNLADLQQEFSKFLYIKDKSGMTPLHHLAMSGAGGNIWQIILEKLPESSLCLQDGSNMTPLHYFAMSSYDSDTWKIILENISSGSLCKEDDDGMTVLHYLVDHCKEENKIKPFKLVFKQIVDKLGADCVIKELFKKATDEYSVIGRSYLPQDS
ncbi:ankyrin repeat domain-containing protein, partial [Candidatus Cardinium hertigii]|uniref:ankyrin repeat domain-containing protein n=1 Tax=Candidatus Cardinium hertigii TaxID=247481 RepID=UPI001FAADD61